MQRYLSIAAILAAACAVSAQSFNVDVSSDGQSAPADTYGAAAGQKGVWNNVLNADYPGEMTLKKLDGSSSSVKVKFPGIGISARNNVFSGDFGKLVNDYHYTSDINQGLFYEISGLERGTYIVYAYSNRPGDDGSSTTYLTIGGKTDYITGTITAGKFEKGVTHGAVLVQINSGQKITIGAMKDTQAGVISGFQLVKVPTRSRLYVDIGATGKNDGSNWQNAYTNLYSAMKAAAFEGEDCEIWVAEGTYLATPDNTSDGDRDDSFVLANSVRVYGGFAGNESSIDERDIAANETNLSGQLGGDDGYTGNTFHIVRASGVNSSAVLDGFTLVAGFADESGADANGPAIYMDGSDATIRNCTFLSNQCVGSGGAVYVTGDSEPTFAGCTFYSNYCLGYGGAIRIVGDVDSGNIPKIWNSRFIRNGCEQSGGAINVTDVPVWAFNSVFIGNFADNHAGAVRCWGEGADSYFGNCTLYGNSAKSVGGVQAAAGADVECRNSIFYANSDDDNTTSTELAQMNTYLDGGTLNPLFNLVHGWTGNLGGQENFTASPQWVNIYGPDGNFGTRDDDVRLKANSPCIDRGKDDLLFRDWLDLDKDGITIDEKTPFDLYGNARKVDNPNVADYIDGVTTVDIGAAEFNPVVHGDMNCDGSVDFNDIDPFVQSLADPEGYMADFPACNLMNGDTDNSGEVDFNDIDSFVECLINGGC